MKKGFSYALVAIGLLSCAHGCNSDSSDDSQKNTSADEVSNPPMINALDNTKPRYVLPTETTFYRVDLARSSDGKVSLQSSSTVSLKLRPFPSLAVEYMLEAHSGDEVLHIAPVSFPKNFLTTSIDSRGAMHESVGELSSSSTTAYIEADSSIDRLVLTAPSGEALLEIKRSQLPKKEVSINNFRQLRKISTGSQLVVSRQQLSEFPDNISLNIKLIDTTNKDQSPFTDAILQGAELIDPDDAMIGVLEEGLNKATPAVRSSLLTVAFVKNCRKPEEGEFIFGEAFGSSFYLCEEIMKKNLGKEQLIYTIVHELAHLFAWLTIEPVVLSDINKFANYPEGVLNDFQELISQYRLVAGMSEAWGELHRSGVDAEKCRAFDEKIAFTKITDDEAREGCFATPYGWAKKEEDIAEYVATVQAPIKKSIKLSGACPRFKDESEITPDIAITYAKLVFLLGVGAISNDNFIECVQSANVEYKKGIHFPGEFSMTDDLRAGTYQQDGTTFLGILGSGTDTYKLLIELALDGKDSSPLGLHRLETLKHQDIVGNFVWDIYPGTSAVYMSNDNYAKARTGDIGLVLVSEYSKEKTQGIIFGLILQNYFDKETQWLPFGTFSIQ